MRFLYDRFVERGAARRVLPPGRRRDRRRGRTRSELLRTGEAVLLFPEGVSGVAKPFSERYRLRPFSPGFARLAMQFDVPVVPVAVVGAEEIYPLVGRAEGVGKRFGMPYLPITPFFPLLGLLGALPLPTKWFISFGPPIRLPAGDEESDYLRARHEAIASAGAASDGDAAQAAPPFGVLRMNRPAGRRPHTYLRVGAAVYPVYGDELRGWSPRADDFRGSRHRPGSTGRSTSCSSRSSTCLSRRAARRRASTALHGSKPQPSAAAARDHDERPREPPEAPQRRRRGAEPALQRRSPADRLPRAPVA